MRPATLRENTPQTLRAGVGFSRLFRFVKPPLRLKKPSRFLQPAFAGCNTLHLASKVVCQTFLLDSLYAGLAPCSPPPAAAGKGGAGDSAMRFGRVSHNHRHHCHHRHRPKNTRRKKKGVERLCLTQSCVSRNARQAPWLPVHRHLLNLSGAFRHRTVPLYLKCKINQDFLQKEPHAQDNTTRYYLTNGAEKLLLSVF